MLFKILKDEVEENKDDISFDSFGKKLNLLNRAI